MWTSLHGFTGLLTVILSLFSSARLLLFGTMISEWEFIATFIVWTVNTVAILPFLVKIARKSPSQWYWLIQFLTGAVSNTFSLAAIWWCADPAGGDDLHLAPPAALKAAFYASALMYFIMGCADFDTGDLGIPFILSVTAYILIYLPIAGVATGGSGWIDSQIAMDGHMILVASNGYAFFAATLHKKIKIHENRSFLYMGAFMVISYGLLIFHAWPLLWKAFACVAIMLATYVVDGLVAERVAWLYDFKRTNRLRVNLYRWSVGKVVRIVLWYAFFAVPMFCTVRAGYTPVDAMVATLLIGACLGLPACLNVLQKRLTNRNRTRTSNVSTFDDGSVPPFLHHNVHTPTGVSLGVHAFSRKASPFPWTQNAFRERVQCLLRRHAALRLGFESEFEFESDGKTRRLRLGQVKTHAVEVAFIQKNELEDHASIVQAYLSKESVDLENLFVPDGPRFRIAVYTSDEGYLCVILYDHLIADAQTWTMFWQELHDVVDDDVRNDQVEGLDVAPFHSLHAHVAQTNVSLLTILGKLRLPHRIATVAHDKQFALAQSRYSHCSMSDLRVMQTQFAAWGGNLTSGLLACVLKGIQTTRPYFRVVVAVDLRRYLTEVKGYGNFAAAISFDVPAYEAQYELPHLVPELHKKIKAGLRDRTFLDDAHLVQSMESKNVEFGHRFGLDRVSVTFSNLGKVALPCDAMLWGALTDAPTCCCTVSTILNKGCAMLANIDFDQVVAECSKRAP